MATDESNVDAGLERVGTTDQVETEGPEVVAVDGRPVAVFHHEGDFHAVDNRCPHMGFPLSEGTVDDGVLTCHWHHARFELSCGDTFDPWADDVQSYPVVVRDGEVYVDADVDDPDPAGRWRERLRDGLEENLDLVLAKSVVGLADAGVPAEEPLSTGLDFGARYREDGWSSGLTILAAMGELLPAVRAVDRRRALYVGLTRVAADCADAPPRFDQPSLSVAEPDPDRLERWFRENVEVRDSDGAERVLRAMVEHCPRERVERALFAAATDHRYMDAGHTLDFCNKAVEALDRAGWEDRAGDVLASLVPRLTTATRSEELSAWRQPVDLAGLLAEANDDLDDLVAAGEGEEWTPPEEFDETLLASDPEAIVTALTDAVAAGATPRELADRVVHAAATRVARFSTGNEFADWNTVHHTFTYANAVREAATRVEATPLYRGVFDAAASVYLDRFLNTPPAPLPDVGAVDVDPETALEDLLAAFDREGTVNEAGRLAAGYLDAGGDPAELKRALARGLLREDADFHTLQAVEAGLRQFDRAGSDRERRTAMVAVARYLAAHSPTRREAEQTFGIAERLHRGERLHEE